MPDDIKDGTQPRNEYADGAFVSCFPIGSISTTEKPLHEPMARGGFSLKNILKIK